MNINWQQFLIGRRDKKGGWIYILAAFPPLFFALWGWEYGAFFIYFPLASLCVLQYFFPTMLCWLILYTLYLFGAIYYSYVFFRDLINLLFGSKSAVSIFVDYDDSMFFIILIGLIVFIAFALYKRKPKQLKI